MTKDEALKLALEALEDAAYEWSGYVEVDTAPRTLLEHLAPRITAIKEALAQPERDPWREAAAQLERDPWREAAAQPEQKPVAWEQFHEYLLERNFCPRCGKRRGGDVNYIHTCTPPREKNT